MVYDVKLSKAASFPGEIFGSLNFEFATIFLPSVISRDPAPICKLLHQEKKIACFFPRSLLLRALSERYVRQKLAEQLGF